MTSPDRIDLVLRATIDDPAALVTWSIDGRHPTPDELDALASLTLEDWERVLTLLHLDKELNGLERQQACRESVQGCREFVAEMQRFLDRSPG